MPYFIVIRLIKLAGHWLNWFCILKSGLANKSGKWFGYLNLGAVQVSERTNRRHVSGYNMNVA